MREREIEREDFKAGIVDQDGELLKVCARECVGEIVVFVCVCVSLFVCVCVRERERLSERERVSERERER